MNPFDPDDYPLRPTVRRLSHLWWGERRLVLIGLACALVYTTLTLSVSVLIQRAIDHAIVPKHVGALWPYVLGILGLSLARFWINFTRRFATARIGVRLEAQLRQMLYEAWGSRARSTTCTPPGRSSRGPRMTSSPSATSSAGASSRVSRAR